MCWLVSVSAGHKLHHQMPRYVSVFEFVSENRLACCAPLHPTKDAPTWRHMSGFMRESQTCRKRLTCSFKQGCVLPRSGYSACSDSSLRDTFSDCCLALSEERPHSLYTRPSDAGLGEPASPQRQQREHWRDLLRNVPEPPTHSRLHKRHRLRALLTHHPGFLLS